MLPDVESDRESQGGLRLCRHILNLSCGLGDVAILRPGRKKDKEEQVMTATGYLTRMFAVLCLAFVVVAAIGGGSAGVATGAEGRGVLPPVPLNCNGTPGEWSGCRGNGCAVCAELVELYPLYFANHPACSPNYTCGGLYFTCNWQCPAPGPGDLCNGTPGQWRGCRGNGCAVCSELVADYPLYFDNHPLCSPNDTCGGQYYTCNERCPAPTQADICDTTPGDVNLNSIVCDIGDVVLLSNFLACLTDLNAEQIANSDVTADCMVDQDDLDRLLDCVEIGGPLLPCVCQEPEVDGCRCVVPGDVNSNGIVAEIGELFYLGIVLCLGGAAPDPLANGDVDGDCDIDLADYYRILDIIIEGGEPAECVCGDPEVFYCE